MLEKLKGIGGITFGVLIFLAALSLPSVFIKGAEWASDTLLPPLIDVGWCLLALNALLLPLSLFKGLRVYTGSGLYLTSFVFGFILWLSSFVLTYSLWGKCEGETEKDIVKQYILGTLKSMAGYDRVDLPAEFLKKLGRMIDGIPEDEFEDSLDAVEPHI